ncbi:MAG TPA: xanthine dehydrogenase family protein molybdopterin-binding subunit [bacterium]|nr:xanthine dehydrogenase family protein molybdopterin-binding subunit [bacterium]
MTDGKGSPPEHAAVGSRIPRIDAAGFVTGQARYATDMGMPGMLHCRLLYAQQAPARIVDVDVTEARRLPGVAAVVTAAEAPAMPPTGMGIAARSLFAAETVRSVADVIAAVAAVDDETAQRAVELIKVTYEHRPGVFSLEAAMTTDAPLVHADKRAYRIAPWLRRWAVLDAGNVSTHFRLRKGDVAGARARAHRIVNGHFRTQRIEHFSMEPHAAVVDVDVATDRVTLWSSTGKPFRTITQLSELLNLSVSRVNAVYVPTGGDFGGKGEVTVEPYCAVLSMQTGRPVKCVYSREEEFFAATCKTPFDIDLAVGADRDGMLLFMEGDLRLDTGAYNSMSGLVATYGAILMEGPYNVPNVAVDARCVFTNNLMSGSFRGFGSPQVAFAREGLLDELAGALGLDPVDLRLRNAWRPGAVTCMGQTLSPDTHGVHVRETIEAAAGASGWAAARVAPRTPAGGGQRRRGIGVATAHHALGGPAVIGTDTATAFVKANPDGSVTVLSGAADVGQGIDTALLQIVAETLHLPRRAITVAFKSTDGVPEDQGASASRTMYSVGNAMHAAAVNLREKLVAVAAKMLEADERDVECADGRLFVRGAPGRVVGIADVVHRAMRTYGEQPIGMGMHHGRGVPMDERAQGEVQAFEYSTQIAEVEVDLGTGEVQVVRLVNSQDVGRAVNPLIVEGQVEGGMMMGLGFALYEEIVCQDGQVMNPYAFDYRTPRAKDTPELVHVLLELRDPTGPYGAKGVGEICMNPTAAAIANAVADAIGARVTSLPITPEKVLAAIRGRARDA